MREPLTEEGIGDLPQRLADLVARWRSGGAPGALPEAPPLVFGSAVRPGSGQGHEGQADRGRTAPAELPPPPAGAPPRILAPDFPEPTAVKVLPIPEAGPSSALAPPSPPPLPIGPSGPAIPGLRESERQRLEAAFPVERPPAPPSPPASTVKVLPPPVMTSEGVRSLPVPDAMPGGTPARLLPEGPAPQAGRAESPQLPQAPASSPRPPVLLPESPPLASAHFLRPEAPPPARDAETLGSDLGIPEGAGPIAASGGGQGLGGLGDVLRELKEAMKGLSGVGGVGGRRGDDREPGPQPDGSFVPSGPPSGFDSIFGNPFGD